MALRASEPVPTADDVLRISAIPNPVLRNLEITHCYWRLAAAFADRTGDGANWCTYATWASRQAGRTIRGEDMIEHLEGRLDERRWLLHPLATSWRALLRRGLFQPGTRLGRFTAELHTPFDAFELASERVAAGNLRVFEEIGLEFARYLNEPRFDRFIARLRPGDPPDGQRYLRQAFSHYEQMRVEPDAKARAELALLANLEIGLHEQTRLQPEIEAALDAAYATHRNLGRRTLAAVFPRAPRFARAPTGAAATLAQRAASRLARQVITDCLMILTLPGRVLALGMHLVDAYPDALLEPANPELVELLARYERPAPAVDH